MGDIRTYFPSGNFLLAILALLIVVILVGLANEYTPTEKTVVYQNPSGTLKARSIDSLVTAATSVDTDSDGLKDWEEALWRTDPKKKDSDGDGTTDGEEIRLKRDPLKKGPADALTAEQIAAGTLGSVENLSATDKFARDFFAQYVQAKQSGESVDAVTQSQIVSQVLSQSNLTSAARVYAEGDLTVHNDGSSAALKSYGNAMGTVLKADPYEGGREREIDIANRALATQNKSELAKLDPIIVVYTSMIKNMLTVSVPRDVVAYHLPLLNSLNGILESIRGMKKILDDPAAGLGSVVLYKKSIESFLIASTNVSAFYKTKEVVFTKDENGVYFVGLSQ